jgi:hypothetical protein
MIEIDDILIVFWLILVVGSRRGEQLTPGQYEEGCVRCD